MPKSLKFSMYFTQTVTKAIGLLAHKNLNGQRWEYTVEQSGVL